MCQIRLLEFTYVVTLWKQYSTQLRCFSSLPASDDFCRYPLQRVWTQIRPDNMSGLIWIQSFNTMIVFLNDFLEKGDFEKKKKKKSADNLQRVNNKVV